MKLILSLILLFSSICFGQLFGQEVIELKSRTSGLSAGVQAGYMSYQDDQIHPANDNGFGYGAHVQYGFNNKFGVDLSFTHYEVKSNSFNNINSPYPYTAIDCTARFFFGSTNSSLRPFLSAGINYTRSQELFQDPNTFFESNEIYSGYGFAGGFGISYFLQPEISIDLSVVANSGSYINTTVNGQDFEFDHRYLSYIGLGGLSYHF
ncbi:MAG: OmpW family outer membrane protein [Saprospiraceae bacterium]